MTMVVVSMLPSGRLPKYRSGSFPGVMFQQVSPVAHPTLPNLVGLLLCGRVATSTPTSQTTALSSIPAFVEHGLVMSTDHSTHSVLRPAPTVKDLVSTLWAIIRALLSMLTGKSIQSKFSRWTTPQRRVRQSPQVSSRAYPRTMV